MLLIQASNISKAYGAESIFCNISLQINTGEKIGVIGANGAGKTTLFRCIMGLENPDEGEVKTAEGIHIGYLPQNVEWTASGTIWDEFVDGFSDVIELKEKIDHLADQMANAKTSPQDMDKIMKEYGEYVERFERADGYNIEMQIKLVASGLGFLENHFSRQVQTLSGGERTRLALAKLLLRSPDILFLDEPTNHLDMEMVEWLETFLGDFKGGLVIISHDRYFLDRVTHKTLVVEAGKGQLYNGNYSKCIMLQEEQREAAQTAFEKQQKWIEKTEAFIDKYKAGVKAKQARGRLNQLSRVQRLQQPEKAKVLGDILFEPPSVSGERILDVKDIQLRYGERVVLDNVSFSLRRYEGVALVGPNGAGKTSLLKIINGLCIPDKGTIRLGGKVKVGYFSQLHENLSLSNRILDEITTEFGFTENVARKYLGVFMFQGDDVFKRIGDLSGGERARVAMLKLLLSDANFLILDEPTNHLDIPSKEAFEKALENYAGTFLVVSHDRYFLDRVVNRVLELNGGHILEYAGGYAYYDLQKKEEHNKPNSTNVRREKGKTNHTQKGKNDKKDYARLLSQTEKEIMALEEEIKILETLLNDQETYNDLEKFRSVSTKHGEISALLNEKLKIWETYMSL